MRKRIRIESGRDGGPNDLKAFLRALGYLAVILETMILLVSEFVALDIDVGLAAKPTEPKDTIDEECHVRRAISGVEITSYGRPGRHFEC
jgi:hypothetical protein